MRTARALLVIALGLTASRTARPEPCARAKLTGDAHEIAAVGAELARLGDTTATTTDAKCRAIDATVLADPHGIAVAIAGGEQRVVGDAQIAATWIDSWLRDDFTGPEAEPVLQPPSTTTPTMRDVPPTATTTSAAFASRLSLGIDGERGYSSDGGAAWNGVTAHACVHVGALCLGARGRLAWQGATSIASVPVSRSDAAVLATASTLFTAGQMQIGPELGLGVGRLTTARGQVCRSTPPPGCGTTDPTMGPPPPDCGMQPPIIACSDPDAQPLAATAGDTRATIAPRATVGLRIAIPLFAHVWLDGNAAVEVSPFGRGGNSGGGMPDASGDVPGLPGDPFATFSVGLGLRVGGGAP